MPAYFTRTGPTGKDMSVSIIAQESQRLPVDAFLPHASPTQEQRTAKALELAAAADQFEVINGRAVRVRDHRGRTINR